MEVQCKLCNRYIELDRYDKHFSRCSSTQYIAKKIKGISIEELNKLDDIEFNKKYFWALNRIYETTNNEKERKRIEIILYGADYGLKEIM